MLGGKEQKDSTTVTISGTMDFSFMAPSKFINIHQSDSKDTDMTAQK